MADDFKFELNYKGVGELLHSEAMTSVLKQHAGKVATRAGSGYEAKQMGSRVIVLVRESAEQDNYRNNTLLKAVGRHD